MVSYDISGCNPIRIQPQIHLAPQSQRNPLQFHKHDGLVYLTMLHNEHLDNLNS